jgi:aconitate hydratase
VRASSLGDVQAQLRSVFEGDANWQAIKVPAGKLYAWDEEVHLRAQPAVLRRHDDARRGRADIRGARALALLGDSVTTDHISPAGDIAQGSPAART